MNIAEEFQPQIAKLYKLNIESLLPIPISAASITEGEIKKLIGVSSALSLSKEPSDLILSYEIMSRLIESTEESAIDITSAADIILSRLGNFPGRTLLRSRYTQDERPSIPISLALERVAREAENSTNEGILLTDFQYKLLEALQKQSSLSVSAPTSAGKSFILNIDLVRRLKSCTEKVIVYIVPTRALISEVSNRIRQTLQRENINDTTVRTAPFPLETESKFKSIVYILTPERLLTLLKPKNNTQQISTLIVDEAHEIQKGNRGIVLHNAVEIALSKHPKTSLMFASPLIKNPGYLLNLFKRSDNGQFFTETVSPVSQNILLISEVNKKPNMVNVSLLTNKFDITIGERHVNFRFRDSIFKQRANLAYAITKNDDSTIIFANDPSDAEKIASELSSLNKNFEPSNNIKEFVSFIKSEIHEEHGLVKSLQSGVAFHYGDIPSIVRAGIEDLFRSGEIKYICCTSTLLQGVNLPAKHIVIDNPYSGKNPMLRSDFLNLAGRAGRLLQEFHGNIWCIRPGNWVDESYKGDTLQEIKSSMDKIMGDGGKIIQELINESLTDEKDKEIAEAGFSKLFHESMTSTDTELTAKYSTSDTAEIFNDNLIHIRSLEVTLPYDILEAHRSLRPDHLQHIYNHMIGVLSIDHLSLLHPFEVGGKERMSNTVDLVCEYFSWDAPVNSIKYRNLICNLAHDWVTGKSIGSILKDRVNYVRRDDDNKLSASSIIRQVLKVIESAIRFRLVKYLSAYEDLLELALLERGFSKEDAQQAPYHTFLEFGSCNKVELGLMSVGFSRFTALRLKKIIGNTDAVDVEDYLEALSKININSIDLPKLCLNELKSILGR